MRLFVAVPSYKGIPDEQARAQCAADELNAAGYEVGVGVVRGWALIDQARAELVTAFRYSKCDAVLLQDDDVSITGASVLDMIKCGKSVVSAPCRMRSEGQLYNVTPYTDPERHNGVRLAETLWTGLGCVLVSREVIEAMCDRYSMLHFRSAFVKGVRAIALFNSLLCPERQLDPNAVGEENEFLGDDRAFSVRLRGMQIPIYASLDARTNHRGFEGCLGESMAANRSTGLLGPDGKPL